MTPELEKRLLQVAIGKASLVPILAGGWAVWRGAAMLGGGNVDLDSHFRYLSGLLLGIGLAFAATIPKIETQTSAIRLLTLIVVCGGLARAWGLFHAVPSIAMIGGLIMELIVTPVLCLWQTRLARRFARHARMSPSSIDTSP